MICTNPTSTLLRLANWVVQFFSPVLANARVPLHRIKEAKEVFGSDDDTHPGIKHLFSIAKDFYVGGQLEAVNRLEHYDFLDLRCKSSA